MTRQSSDIYTGQRIRALFNFIITRERIIAVSNVTFRSGGEECLLVPITTDLMKKGQKNDRPQPIP